MREVATRITLQKLRELKFAKPEGKRKKLRLLHWYEDTIDHLYKHGHVTLYTHRRGIGYTTFLAALAVEAIRPSGCLTIAGGTCVHVCPARHLQTHFMETVGTFLDEHDNVKKVSPFKWRHTMTGYDIESVIPMTREFDNVLRSKPDLILTDEMTRYSRHASSELHQRMKDGLDRLRRVREKITEENEWNECRMVELN